MKFLDIQGLNESVKVEAFNKKFWFLCQHWLAARQGPQQRFRDLITSIPEIRFVASSLKKVPAEKISLLFKVRFLNIIKAKLLDRIMNEKIA